MQKNAIVLAGVVAAGLSAGHASPASASIVTYDLIPNSSDIVVTGTISGGLFNNATLDFNGATSWQLNLTSGSMTLDSGAPALDAFSFDDTSAGPETIKISGGPTLGTLSLSNIVVGSTLNPDAPLTGSDPYGLSTTNVMDDANYSVTAGSSIYTGTVSNTGTPLTGTIVMGVSPPLSFNQTDVIQLGTASFSLAGTSYTVSLKGDINFEGVSPVPLPASAGLLGGGLGMLMLLHMRRRAAGSAAEATGPGRAA
jgi:hypothetical protein